MTSSNVLRKNIYANYLSALMTTAAPIIALPFYLNLLGPKLFGLVSFVTSIQVALTLLDSGISQTAVREFSVSIQKSINSSRHTAELLFNLERIYWLLGISAAIATASLADPISRHWLHLDDDTAVFGRQAVLGAALLFAVQFPGSLYRSFLVASQAQVKLNYIVVSATIIRHLGAIALLTNQPLLTVYLAWHIGVTLLETLTRAVTTWKTQGIERNAVRWNYSFIRPLVPVMIKLSSAVLMGALATQLDKIILSRMVPIEQFGYYAMASTLSLGVLNLIYPLMQAFSPRIMQSAGDTTQLRRINIKLMWIIISLVAICTVGFIAFGKFILQIWLHNPDTETIVHQLLSVLLIGSALNALYHVGYFNWLANGRTKKILFVNALSLASSLIFIPLFVREHGLIGATFGFVTMNLIGFVASLDWIKTRPKACH